MPGPGTQFRDVDLSMIMLEICCCAELLIGMKSPLVQCSFALKTRQVLEIKTSQTSNLIFSHHVAPKGQKSDVAMSYTQVILTAVLLTNKRATWTSQSLALSCREQDLILHGHGHSHGHGHYLFWEQIMLENPFLDSVPGCRLQIAIDFAFSCIWYC